MSVDTTFLHEICNSFPHLKKCPLKNGNNDSIVLVHEKFCDKCHERGNYTLCLKNKTS